MLAECAFLYPDGRKCRRLPRRGERLCRDHRSLTSARPKDDEETFDREMTQATLEIIAMPLDQMLDHLQQSLIEIDWLIESRASTAERYAYTRATIAVTAAIDCVLEHPRVLAAVLPSLPPGEISCLLRLLRFAAPQFPPDPRLPDESAAPATKTPVSNSK